MYETQMTLSLRSCRSWTLSKEAPGLGILWETSRQLSECQGNKGATILHGFCKILKIKLHWLSKEVCYKILIQVSQLDRTSKLEKHFFIEIEAMYFLIFTFKHQFQSPDQMRLVKAGLQSTLDGFLFLWLELDTHFFHGPQRALSLWPLCGCRYFFHITLQSCYEN